MAGDGRLGLEHCLGIRRGLRHLSARMSDPASSIQLLDACGPLATLLHLSFEVGTNCNLARSHSKCPASQANRWPDTTRGPLSVADIVKTIEDARSLGFRGYVGFHYYNEPLLERGFILNVIQRSTYQRFMLWTNGLLLGRDDGEDDVLPRFDWVMISVYDWTSDGERFARLARRYPHTRIDLLQADLDDRLGIYRREPHGTVRCWRPRLDLPIDHFGNVHLCCQDWRGSVPLGNIRRDSLRDALTQSGYAGIIGSLCEAEGDSPRVCRACTARVGEDTYAAYRQRYDGGVTRPERHSGTWTRTRQRLR